MRDILDALENVQTNKKKPMDVKKEMNKKPAVMKALSLESETNEAISEKGRANLRKMIGDFERMAEDMNLSDESLDSIAMHLDQIMSDVQEIEGVRENKTPGDSHYNKEKAKELAKKDGKDPEKLTYGELQDYISKAENMKEDDEDDRMAKTDRASVKLDDVKPGLEALLSELMQDKNEWHDRYDALEKGLRQQGLTDPNAIRMKIYDMDDDIVSYVNIDDVEDKIEALQNLMKMGDADGNDIISTAEFGVSDTVPREELKRDMKSTIKQNHPEVYNKLFMYDVDEQKTTEDKFDGYKIHRLGELQRKIDDVAKDIRLLGKTDSMPGATGAGDLTDQLTTMNKAIQMLQDVIERANSIVPDPLKQYDGSPKIENTENNMETTTTKVDEGGMKQAEIEVQDWVAKYENHTGVNGDELPKGYLQAMLNSGIMSDAYDQDEYMAFNKMNGYEDDGDWQEGDMEKFMASSPITGGMFNAIDMIKTKYGIDDDMINSIMGYFDEGKTNQKDTVEVAVEDLARVLELAGLGKEVKKADEQAQAEATSEVELDEYSNSPDEDYFDTDTQLNKMSGGLNGPKKMYKKEYPGDNPLAVDLEQKLAKMLSDM